MEEAKKAAKEDSEYLASCGFEIIREKIGTRWRILNANS